MEITLTVFCLLLSAVFSGIEIAFISANKLQIEINKNTGSFSGRILSKFSEKPALFISTLLIGNNIALVAFSSLMAKIIPNLYHNQSIDLLYKTILSTVIIFIFGEFFPKVIFKSNQLRTLSFFAPLLQYLVFLPLKPLALFFEKVSTILIEWFTQKKVRSKSIDFSFLDLENFIQENTSKNHIEHMSKEKDINSDMINRVLYLKDLKIRDCMIPRTEIVAISHQSSISEIRQKFIDTRLSKLLVYKDSIDQIAGYIHHHDILKGAIEIEHIMFSIPVVPETLLAKELLNKLKKEQKSIALVVDEYGGTSGIVTLEDIIEEIFGEIVDEHDKDPFVEEVLDNNYYLFSGRLEINYLNEKYHLDIPLGEYDTIAGFVVITHKNIPLEGEIIQFGNFEIEIIQRKANRIESLKIKKINQ